MDDAPIPAATLIAVRDRPGENAPKLLMVERAQGMAFAGGALVFPGGRIDPADSEHGNETPDHAARVAAIRETLEETAIAVGLRPLPSPETARELQRLLVAGEAFADLLAHYGLDLHTAALTPLARWVPELHVSRRFDTMFFVARAPEGDWPPNACAGECAGAFWITAGEALERDRRGEARLIFPTRRTLERLAQHAQFEAIRRDAQIHPVQPITPWIEEHDGERHIAIPAGIGFPVVREKVTGLWRG